MFMQDKGEKKSKDSGTRKRKLLEDFYKGKNLTLNFEHFWNLSIKFV